MTAEEIRKEYRWDAMEPNRAHLKQVEVLGEIAAQLAEQNENLKIIADAMYADGMAKYGQ